MPVDQFETPSAGAAFWFVMNTTLETRKYFFSIFVIFVWLVKINSTKFANIFNCF